MLRITEHFQYSKIDSLKTFMEVATWENYFLPTKEPLRISFGKKEDKDNPCIAISLREKEGQKFCDIDTSYYIGLDRIKELKNLTVLVTPKVDNEQAKLDYVKMLTEALTETANLEHLDGLVEIKFHEEPILVDQDEQFLLQPFLVVQFLQVLKAIVRKGLKKSYYQKTENMQSRVKGRILVGQQIKHNLAKNRVTHTMVSYQEFGVDTAENQFLKFVLSQVSARLVDFPTIKDSLQTTIDYCKGGMQQVSSKTFRDFHTNDRNPFYRNYSAAIELGNQILKMNSLTIVHRSSKKVAHPPFWIDMSKLFELFVFKKLKQAFPAPKAVLYHEKVHGVEPDFLINTPELKAIVDAKYKPRYEKGNPSLADARQLAGYARLNAIYHKLGIEDDSVIPTYFVYPSQLRMDNKVELKDEEEEFETIEIADSKFVDQQLRTSKKYRKMYLVSVDLPVVGQNLFSPHPHL